MSAASANRSCPTGVETSYLQRFTARRGKGTASERNRRLAQRLLVEGKMTSAGLEAQGMR